MCSDPIRIWLTVVPSYGCTSLINLKSWWFLLPLSEWVNCPMHHASLMVLKSKWKSKWYEKKHLLKRRKVNLLISLLEVFYRLFYSILTTSPWSWYYISPFYRWGSGGFWKLHSLPKVTRLVRDQSGLECKPGLLALLQECLLCGAC